MERKTIKKSQIRGRLTQKSWAWCSHKMACRPGASAIPGRRAPAPSPGSRADAPAHLLLGRGRRGLRALRGGWSEADKVRRPGVHKGSRGAAARPASARLPRAGLPLARGRGAITAQAGRLSASVGTGDHWQDRRSLAGTSVLQPSPVGAGAALPLPLAQGSTHTNAPMHGAWTRRQGS